MKPLIVANWKMNPETLFEAKKLFSLVKKGIKNVKNAKVVICPPFVYLPILITNGSQDCFWEEKGAYTGEISAKMLKNLGCQYVIIGHSERRRYQKETDEMINKKLKAVLKEKLKPILCIDKISQIPKDIKGNLILAYEPVFAIGTGKPCSIKMARKMKISIRKNLKKNMPVLYGGSVNSQNAKNYIKKAGFQGLLVGGASLNPKEFLKIVKSIDLISKDC